MMALGTITSHTPVRFVVTPIGNEFKMKQIKIKAKMNDGTEIDAIAYSEKDVWITKSTAKDLITMAEHMKGIPLTLNFDRTKVVGKIIDAWVEDSS